MLVCVMSILVISTNEVSPLCGSEINKHRGCSADPFQSRHPIQLRPLALPRLSKRAASQRVPLSLTAQ